MVFKSPRRSGLEINLEMSEFRSLYADNNYMEPALTDANLKNLLLKMTDTYKNATKHFVQFLTLNNLAISFKGLKAYIHYLKNPKSNYRPNTYNLYIASLKNRIRFLFRLTPSFFDDQEQIRIKQLLSALKYEKIKRKEISKKEILSIGEIKKLITKAPSWLALMIRFLFMTGIRISEMLKIRYLDIKQDRKDTLIMIRGRNERTINIETPFMYTIAKHFNGNTFLFENKKGDPFHREMVSMSIKRLGKNILNKNISAHTFRHTFAALIIKKTGKIKGVSEYLGHQSVQTTVDMYVQQQLNSTDLNIVKL